MLVCADSSKYGPSLLVFSAQCGNTWSLWVPQQSSKMPWPALLILPHKLPQQLVIKLQSSSFQFKYILFWKTLPELWSSVGHPPTPHGLQWFPIFLFKIIFTLYSNYNCLQNHWNLRPHSQMFSIILSPMVATALFQYLCSALLPG